MSVESLAFLGLDPPVVVAVSFLLTIFYILYRYCSPGVFYLTAKLRIERTDGTCLTSTTGKNPTMVARSRPAGKAPGSKKSPAGKKSPQAPQGGNKPLNTSKGQFTFTMVTDGCYIEHKVRRFTPTKSLSRAAQA